MEVERARQRRYVRLPEDCVSLCMENLGIQASREVTSVLVEDVSFRIRQVTKLALEFANHANRKRVCKEDFDNALKWSGIEPLYGHNVEPPPFIYIHENGLYSVEDQEMPLRDLSLSSPVVPTDLPPPPSLTANWLMIEGVPVEVEGPQLDLPTTVQLKKPLIESHQRYLSLLLEAITGESEDLCRIALCDLHTNPAVANILPDLVQYLLETLSCWVEFSPAQLIRVLKLLYSLFRNKHLFFDPHGTRLFPLVKSIILTPSYLHTGPCCDHWHVRRMSAVCLAEITHCCGTPLNEYIPAIYTSFRHILAQSDVSLHVLYGVVLSLCQLGGKSVAEVLFPRLDTLCHYVQSLLASRDLATREAALKVHETLLFSSEILLMSGIPVEVRPEHISSTSSMAVFSQHGLSSQATGSRHDTSFLSSFVMDTSDLSLGGPQQQMPSLYEVLVDLFGENLIQRLTTHVKNMSSLQKKGTVKPEVQGRRNEPVQTKDTRPVPREDILLNFLKREGFQPCKVQLPLKVMPRKPPAFHPWGRQLWRFQIATTLLPVQGNVLEGTTLRSRGRRRGSTTLPKYITRHTYRRGTLRTRVHVDLGVMWL